MDWIGLVLAVGGGLWAAVTFNRMVRLRQLTHNAWSDIDVLLKQRHDLIPNLVATVKSYAGFESSTLEDVVRARNAAQAAPDFAARAAAETEIQSSLTRLFALVENYPQLKAIEQFDTLQRQLIKIENDLQSARRYYNATVRDHNTLIQTFPNNLLAQMLSFSDKEYFQVEDEVRAAPAVAV